MAFLSVMLPPSYPKCKPAPLSHALMLHESKGLQTMAGALVEAYTCSLLTCTPFSAAGHWCISQLKVGVTHLKVDQGQAFQLRWQPGQAEFGADGAACPERRSNLQV